MAKGLYGMWFAHSSKLFAFCGADMQPSCLEVISSTWGGCNLLPLRLKLFSKSRRARRECAPQALSGQFRFFCDSSLQARIVVLSGKTIHQPSWPAGNKSMKNALCQGLIQSWIPSRMHSAPNQNRRCSCFCCCSSLG